jgi:hypothetical protein
VSSQLPSRVAVVGKDGLYSDPGTLRAQEPDQRSNVLHHRQPVAHGIGLVELDSLGGFLGIKECYTGVSCRRLDLG